MWTKGKWLKGENEEIDVEVNWRNSGDWSEERSMKG